MDHVNLFLNVFAVTLGVGAGLAVLFGAIIFAARLGAEKVEEKHGKHTVRLSRQEDAIDE